MNTFKYFGDKTVGLSQWFVNHLKFKTNQVCAEFENLFRFFLCRSLVIVSNDFTFKSGDNKTVYLIQHMSIIFLPRLQSQKNDVTTRHVTATHRSSTSQHHDFKPNCRLSLQYRWQLLICGRTTRHLRSCDVPLTAADIS